MRLLVFFVLCWATTVAAGEAPTGGVILTLTDYLWGGRTSGPAMEQILAANGEPGTTVFHLGVDAHASAASAGPEGHLAKYEFWKVWSGETPLAEWSGLRRRKLWYDRLKIGARPRRAILLEVHYKHMVGSGRRAQEAEQAYTAARDALKVQVEACRQAGTPVLLYAIAGRTNCSGYRERGETKPWTSEALAAELAAMDRPFVAFARDLQAPVIPTYRAFTALRVNKPELDLHAPRTAHDTHLSPRDAYLVGCVAATTLLGRRLDPPPAAMQATIFAHADRKAASFAKKNKQPMPEPICLAEEEMAAIHDAAWQAVEEFNKLVAGE